MILYPAEWNARKEAVFAALAQADGGGRRLWTIPWSMRDFPESGVRVAHCLSRAKRQPQGLGRWLKAQLIRLQYNGARRLFARHPGAVAVAWNGLGGSRLAFLLAARDAGLSTLACELAPFPDRITIDPLGVNAESLVARTDDFGTDASDAWRAMGQGLTARASRRADVGQAQGAPEGDYLFCPLQVPDDSQVTLFAGWCGGMPGFLSALTQAAAHLPQGWHLRVKEHPSARQPLNLTALVATGRVVVDNATDSFAQLAAARAVVTLNSSMGLQAFFHDKPVLTLGRAFWARPGLANPVTDQTALNASFAAPDSLTFDAASRARFMNWLDRHYYPSFKFPPGQADSSAFAEKLRQARKFAANAASALSPPDPLR
jgi:capsular polysaccharide export protein